VAAEKPRILIVEDDPDTAESYRLVLEGGGYDVHHAATAPAAWQMTSSWRPQLILLDLMLPEGTEGLDLLWELRRSPDPELAGIPVLLASAVHLETGLQLVPRDAQEHASQSEFLPASGFLDKPVAPASLLASVKTALRDGAYRASARAPESVPATAAPLPAEPPEASSEPLEPEQSFALTATTAAPFLSAGNCRFGKPVVSPALELLEFRTPTGARLVGPAEPLRRRDATDLESALAVSIPLCASWNYAIRRERGGYQATLENALASLRLMADMGFHFVEVEGYGRSGVTRLFDERKRVKQRLDEWGLRALLYCFVDSGFAHVDFLKRARDALDRFQNLALPTAAALGAQMIRINSFTPSDALYLDPAGGEGESRYHIWPPYSDEELVAGELKLPADFELKPTWRALASGCRIAAALAGRQGLPLLMEPRRRELCETIGDLINLCNDVDFPNFHVVLDTAHANYGEEFLIAVRKLAELPKRPGRILCIHASDNDGSSYLHGAVGDYEHRGGIDWHQFAEFLKLPVFREGKPFRGPLVVDCGSPGMRDLEASTIASARRLQEILTEHDLPWLI
jgi:CheY-like chemotaxis protein/sugar phosphate isomerase/epimerase